MLENAIIQEQNTIQIYQHQASCIHEPIIDVYKRQIPYRDPGKKVFTRGDVLIVNDNLAHYRGELEIVLTEIPNDGERNLVATIKPEELMLLDFVKPGHHFKLLK